MGLGVTHVDLRGWGLTPGFGQPAAIDRFSDFMEKAFPWIFWIGMISLGTVVVVIAGREERERRAS